MRAFSNRFIARFDRLDRDRDVGKKKRRGTHRRRRLATIVYLGPRLPGDTKIVYGDVGFTVYDDDDDDDDDWAQCVL